VFVTAPTAWRACVVANICVAHAASSRISRGCGAVSRNSAFVTDVSSRPFAFSLKQIRRHQRWFLNVRCINRNSCRHRYTINCNFISSYFASPSHVEECYIVYMLLCLQSICGLYIYIIYDIIIDCTLFFFFFEKESIFQFYFTKTFPKNK